MRTSPLLAKNGSWRSMATSYAAIYTEARWLCQGYNRLLFARIGTFQWVMANPNKKNPLEPAGQTLSGGVFGEFGNNSTCFCFREEIVGLLGRLFSGLRPHGRA
jgi:hypothetical protein